MAYFKSHTFRDHAPAKQLTLKRVPVAQWLEHCVSSAKVVGSIPREHTY